MIRTALLFILLLFAAQTYGQANKRNRQKKNDIVQQCERINAALKYYETLSPFSGPDDRAEQIDSVNMEVVTLLLKVLNEPRILNYEIEKLITGNELVISRSADKHIYFFSIDEKTGGSYRSSKTIIHYRLANGFARALLMGDDVSEALTTATYGQVFLLDSLAHKYFVLGSVQTCNTCNASLAITLAPDTASLNIKLVAQYDGRYHDLKAFDYNTELKELTFEFDAADHEDSLYGGDNDRPGFIHRYKNKFRYINGEFVRVESCEFWDVR